MRIPASCSAGKLRSNAGCVSSSETTAISKLVFVCACICVCTELERKSSLLNFALKDAKTLSHIFVWKRSVCLDETCPFRKYTAWGGLTPLALLLNFCSH